MITFFHIGALDLKHQVEVAGFVSAGIYPPRALAQYINRLYPVHTSQPCHHL